MYGSTPFEVPIEQEVGRRERQRVLTLDLSVGFVVVPFVVGFFDALVLAHGEQRNKEYKEKEGTRLKKR